MAGMDTIMNLEKAIVDGDTANADKWAKKILDEKIDIHQAIDQGLIKGIRKVGEDFGDGEIFLPDLILSSEAMKVASEILEEELRKTGGKMKTGHGKIVIGTVKGDIHDIGKTLVATLFKAAGLTVIDLGVDVPKEKFIAAVEENNPDLLGLSSLLTSSAEEQRTVIQELEKKGLRSQVKVMVGGSAISEHWADEIGADAYAGDAREAVEVGSRLLT